MKTRDLTFNEAVEEHRKMWRWIAENIEEGEPLLDAKERYLKGVNGIPKEKLPHDSCFCCQYDYETRYKKSGRFDFRRCTFCPLKWNSDKEPCYRKGPFMELDRYQMPVEKRREICLEIANLPINEEEYNRVKNISSNED